MKRYIAASAAALYIICTCLSEYGKSCALSNGRRLFSFFNNTIPSFAACLESSVCALLAVTFWPFAPSGVFGWVFNSLPLHFFNPFTSCIFRLLNLNFVLLFYHTMLRQNNSSFVFSYTCSIACYVSRLVKAIHLRALL